MNVWAIILAAGLGRRMLGACAVPKQYLLHDGVPLFWHGARVFSRIPAISGLVFVFPPDPASERGFDPCALLASLHGREPLGMPFVTAVGGERRQDSVANALAVLPGSCDAVLVHDGARPFLDAALVLRVIAPLGPSCPAVIPGIALSDTVKAVDGAGRVMSTPPRDTLRAVQTPQAFLLAPLREAHERAFAEGRDVTDDAALMEHCGHRVFVVEGDMGNKKITTADDLSLLCAKAAPEFLPCTGFGYDVHRYGGTRPFILGGVPIACDILVSAHSDGDVLLHALMDALLGCLGLGDIGSFFPDTDPSFDNISSGILLAEVLEKTRTAGLRITHVDLTVIAQVPRVAPHRKAIAVNVAKLLGLPEECVAVKATTEERLGFTGEKKGIKAVALVSALKPGVPAKPSRAGVQGYETEGAH
ncbi:2-C-methyl-D-erythritol 4-phosphate cytidylyltransferase [Desulfovibrio sp. OttesenSCG-928-G15]|nr:2-C-methyl-D-erythritol 4-phosphate cytidylyltransferase [Desulfovibrio sp. OttesenSCG-928-G15]